MTLTIIGLLLFTLLTIRVGWLQWKLTDYYIKAIYFVCKAGLSIQAARDMSEIWPKWLILSEIWRWDFSRYVVHQDLYCDMNELIDSELKREDLSMAEYAKVISEVEAKKPAQSDPSVN